MHYAYLASPDAGHGHFTVARALWWGGGLGYSRARSEGERSRGDERACDRIRRPPSRPPGKTRSLTPPQRQRPGLSVFRRAGGPVRSGPQRGQMGVDTHHVRVQTVFLLGLI